MKALDEYILMVLFVLLLKRVHFLANETQRCQTTQLKALDEYILMELFVLFHFLVALKIYSKKETWK